MPDTHRHTRTHAQCIARMEGLKAARQSLEAWQGYDARLCMAQVLELYKGETTLEEVDNHQSATNHTISPTLNAKRTP